MSSLQTVVDTLENVRKFAGTTVLIKIGGAALQDPELVERICRDVIAIRAVGISPILVHGGGPAINAELDGRGVKSQFHEGLRITSDEMMEVIETVLCGSVNRLIVRTLCAQGAKAIGFSGVDARTLLCKQASSHLGRVGQIERVNPSLIQAVLNMQNEEGLRAIPVIAPVALGFDGLSYNINADWAASHIASRMSVTKVLFMTDQEGVLDAEGKLIAELDAGELERLIEQGVVKGGMLAKCRTVLDALKKGITDVHIFNARRPHGLIEEIFTEHGVGTVCRLRSISRPSLLIEEALEQPQ